MNSADNHLYMTDDDDDDQCDAYDAAYNESTILYDGNKQAVTHCLNQTKVWYRQIVKEMGGGVNNIEIGCLDLYTIDNNDSMTDTGWTTTTKTATTTSVTPILMSKLAHRRTAQTDNQTTDRKVGQRMPYMANQRTAKLLGYRTARPLSTFFLSLIFLADASQNRANEVPNAVQDHGEDATLLASRARNMEMQKRAKTTQKLRGWSVLHGDEPMTAPAPTGAASTDSRGHHIIAQTGSGYHQPVNHLSRGGGGALGGLQGVESRRQSGCRNREASKMSQVRRSRQNNSGNIPTVTHLEEGARGGLEDIDAGRQPKRRKHEAGNTLGVEGSRPKSRGTTPGLIAARDWYIKKHRTTLLRE
ncbi:hypothetical protein PUNSTDRAFT_136218 [Punctularia strigosozonata HHB-11173 SS5]|uniref:uncharacterized protein n=1 Tax=Punctularia strigosozonata (strain HHB-11173) TaxID=741275 RepID=UPI00044178BE|nr:uncharacterized protein PUNSTDRAFT_136218 [Punctularia strigosozonata HHB-11173 SS5]EIN07537.1 hypothetical protein PUNSTDRAFT_136218 [Punctularia strigosozonata HHB-11173 SS5]